MWGKEVTWASYAAASRFIKPEWVYHKQKLSGRVGFEDDFKELRAFCRVQGGTLSWML